MESLMRFGRRGCVAVLQHYEAWKKSRAERTGKTRKEERWQIEYARAAERIWFQRNDELHLELQDIWESRIANKHPVRGCLRKVVSMVRMSPTGIRLRRKKEWFCEARRHAAKFMRSTSRVHSTDKREVGDRGELVLFSSPEDAHEIYQVLERYYEEASKLFTNNRTKDQAGILVAHIRQRGYYPIRTTQAFQWLSSRKKNIHRKKKRRAIENPQSSVKTKVRKQTRSRAKRKRSGAASTTPKGTKRRLPVNSRKKERSVLVVRPASQQTGQQLPTSDRKITQTTKRRKSIPTKKSRKDENKTNKLQDKLQDKTKILCKQNKTKLCKQDKTELCTQNTSTSCIDASPFPATAAASTPNPNDSKSSSDCNSPQPSFVMSILEDDKVVSDLIQSFEHQEHRQHDCLVALHHDFAAWQATQPLLEGLDSLLRSDLDQLLPAVDRPRTPPCAERRYGSDSSEQRFSSVSSDTSDDSSNDIRWQIAVDS